jgi:hypothetical protein
MTEVEWITTDKMPLYMLAEYPGKRSERKAFLASVYCLRHCWHLLSDLQRRYVEVVESLAEGHGTQEEANRLWNQLNEPANQRNLSGSAYYAYHAVRSFFCSPYECVINVFREIAHAASYTATDEKQWQCGLIREVFGNPFRPVVADPLWLTADVFLLARGIYDERAFDRMPILADALQDAGCDNVNVLDHCREQGEHVRGCWVVDMLLGKG